MMGGGITALAGAGGHGPLPVTNDRFGLSFSHDCGVRDTPYRMSRTAFTPRELSSGRKVDL